MGVICGWREMEERGGIRWDGTDGVIISTSDPLRTSDYL